MNRIFRVAGRFLFFVALTVAATLTFQATSAHAVGTIRGGTFCVETTLGEGEKGCVLIEDPLIDVTLSPDAPGSTEVISAGKIELGNVPAGIYTVTIEFEQTKETCSNITTTIGRVVPASGIIELITGFNPLGALLGARVCDDDGVYRASRVFGNVRVADNQTTYLVGDNDTENRLLAKSIRVDPETGLPVIVCAGESNLFVDWVICPAIEFTFRAIDLAITYMLVPFLSINPLSATTTDSSGQTVPSEIYQIWDNIRNLTNIVFILVFFVMIFWQAIGSIYGVKKILPRLIAMAILANLSFFLCQLLIDFSNILGVGMASFLTTVLVGGQPILDMNGIAAPLFALTVPILVALFIFIIFALIMILIGCVVLILRQVVLIFLVIISPLAFAAGVLPNTAKLMSQWFSMFIRLVLMYPIIMLMLAAGRIASHIISNIGAQF